MKQSSAIINLSSLLELSGRLNESNDESFILNSTMLSLMGKLRILRTCVLIPDSEGTFDVILSKGKKALSKIDFFNPSGFSILDETISGNSQLIDAGYKYCVPLKYNQGLLAVICLGKRLLDDVFSEEESEYTNLVCTISAYALQNARNHVSLIEAKNKVEQRNQLLTTLFEMSRDFSTLLSREQIIKMLALHLMGQLLVSRFALVVMGDNNIPEELINRLGNLSGIDFKLLISKAKSTIEICDTCIPDFDVDALKEFDIKVISPMLVKGISRGLLVVGPRMNGEAFNEENIFFIETLSNTAISALENDRLFREELEKKRLESELALALEIQKNLLPKSIPKTDRLDLAGISIPSRHVGGDYYDFIRLDNDRILVVIADVSGKGMPASLIMANIQAALRLLVPLSIALTDLILKLNEIVYNNTASDRFVTLFVGIINSRTYDFDYINAGHNPPVLFKKDHSHVHLVEGGLILGFLEDPMSYELGHVNVMPGDYIVLYTDGVSEAHNILREEYEESRLISVAGALRMLSADEIIDNIVEDIRRFSEGTQQYDDITLVVMKTPE